MSQCHQGNPDDRWISRNLECIPVCSQSQPRQFTRLQLARKSEHESQGGLSDSDVWIAAGNGEISAVRTLFSRIVNNCFQVMSGPVTPVVSKTVSQDCIAKEIRKYVIMRATLLAERYITSEDRQIAPSQV